MVCVRTARPPCQLSDGRRLCSEVEAVETVEEARPSSCPSAGTGGHNFLPLSLSFPLFLFPSESRMTGPQAQHCPQPPLDWAEAEGWAPCQARRHGSRAGRLCVWLLLSLPALGTDRDESSQDWSRSQVDSESVLKSELEPTLRAALCLKAEATASHPRPSQPGEGTHTAGLGRCWGIDELIDW